MSIPGAASPLFIGAAAADAAAYQIDRSLRFNDDDSAYPVSYTHLTLPTILLV